MHPAPLNCPAVDVPNAVWGFCPSLGAAYAYCVLFAITLGVHIFQGVYYRKAYSWVIAMSALWQLLTYGFRIASIYQPTSVSLYSVWFTLILIAPLWTNAYVYMVMGRMVWNFTTKAKVLGLSAWRFTLIFVILDVVYVAP